MKKIINILLISFVLLMPLQAQVDRSVQPKPGPSPKVNLTKPQSFVLPNGLTVLVVENHKLPRVTFSLSLDNPPVVEGDKVGVSSLTSSMMGNGTSKISKDDFNEKIDYYGASVSFGAGRVSGSSLSRYFSEVLSLAAQGAIDPLFTQEELENEKAKLIDGLKTQEKSASFIASKVAPALVYGKNHPKGEFETVNTINGVTLGDIKNFYTQYFVPENAYLVIVGDVKFEEVKKQVTADFSSWKKASALKTPYQEPVNLSKTEINFINVPSAVQAEIYVMNVTDLKMTDPDYFSTLIANQILGGGGEGRLFLNLREAHAWTYGAYSSISGGKYVDNFSASTSVRNSVVDSAVVELLQEIEKVRTTLPTQDELDLSKAKFIGSFVMNAEKPQTIAGFALREKTQNLPSDFYENYIKNVNNVTLEQVRAAAAKHILHNGTRIVIVGKGSEIIPTLDRLGIPVKYYDSDANPTQKPEEQKISEGVTATSILNNYITAVGGKHALESVKSIKITAEGDIQGNKLTLIQKSTVDGKSSQEMQVMGMTMMKMVFDGKKGYVSQQGQKQELGEKEIAEMKYTVPFPELLFLNAPIKLKGIEDSNYVLQLDDRTYYYDINSNLKTAEAVNKEMAPGQTITQKAYFSDYKDVKGVKIPYIMSINLGMDIEMKVIEVKVNEDVEDADFE